ncbi:hypothetical protein E0485_15540 [Paenibacillus albiflavus]|uniref:Mor transcription activator domain-containing protein n=1 Tax=Paenibacillus albiflavus TaxID=2545760 RepID=A0A4V2WNK4_9BACL|nr:CD3324 family protein [Paenibacillus albiflavus]TCZ75792.1 hypothetical protein E0485_15540 [Paenibacillus albiflavus]
MQYVNAEMVFPEELLKEIQKYIPGGMVYIPKPEELHRKWGEKSGNRLYLNDRNQDIRRQFTAGATIEQLAEQFHLSFDSIKRIVYSKKE